MVNLRIYSNYLISWDNPLPWDFQTESYSSMLWIIGLHFLILYSHSNKILRMNPIYQYLFITQIPFHIYEGNFNYFSPKLCKELDGFLKKLFTVKNMCGKKICAPFAVYFHALLVWLSSSLHSRECSTLLQAMIALAFLLNAPMNHWEFSNWSGHSWTSSYFVWAYHPLSFFTWPF